MIKLTIKKENTDSSWTTEKAEAFKKKHSIPTDPKELDAFFHSIFRLGGAYRAMQVESQKSVLENMRFRGSSIDYIGKNTPGDETSICVQFLPMVEDISPSIGFEFPNKESKKDFANYLREWCNTFERSQMDGKRINEIPSRAFYIRFGTEGARLYSTDGTFEYLFSSDVEIYPILDHSK